MKTKYIIALLTILFLGFTTLSYAQGGHHRERDVIFSNGNIGGVLNNPTAPTTFTTDHSYRITNIMTYHWNDAYGQQGGTISLRAENGNYYGPWHVTTAPGQGGVPDAYWHARPDIVIPPGSYMIIDSSPETWAQNDGTGGQGIAEVRGYRERRGNDYRGNDDYRRDNDRGRDHDHGR